MKKLLLILSILMLWSAVYASDVEAPQKFQVVFTITFNELTLEEAADKEVLIKNKCKDACKIDISIKAINNIYSSVIPAAQIIYGGEFTTDIVFPIKDNPLTLEVKDIDTQPLYYFTPDLTDDTVPGDVND